MPARIYLLVAESERELHPTFVPSPDRPRLAAIEVMDFEAFRGLDPAGVAAVVDRLGGNAARIRNGEIR